MKDSQSQHSAASVPDRDGVRILRPPPVNRARIWMMRVIVVAIAGAGIAYWRVGTPPTQPESAASVSGQDAGGAEDPAGGQRTSSARSDHTPSRRPPRRVSAVSSSALDDARSGDENDLASHISADDPEPTMTEVIDALRASGEHGGLAAFNPPGTSPPLMGLAVPEDFELPPGYVRHHQVTDAGEPIEAILMFSPDHVFRDADGQPIAIPEDRVVPPELAPPGLPIRPVTLPPPPE